MSLDAEWDSAVPIGTKPGADLASEWSKAKPITFGKGGSGKPEKPPLADIQSSHFAGAEALGNMATGMIAKPVSDIAGLAATGKEMVSPTPGGGDPGAFKADVQRRLTYEPRTQWGQAAAQYNPLALIAKMFGWAGDKAEGAANRFPVPQSMEPVREAAAHGINEAVQQAPGFIGLKAPPAAAAASGALKEGARGVMQSALKPPLEAQRTGKAAKAIDTLLDEGVNVSAGGVDTLRGRIDVLTERIAKVIENSPATVNKAQVGARLSKLMDKFEQQVTPMKDVAQIQKAWEEFMAHPLLNERTIPVEAAQKMKQGTYKALGDKNYGELKGAEIEAQKTLARGLKEEIAKVVPDVQPLNAAESKLLNALSLTERRVLMEANKNPVGFGWLTLNPAHFAAWMADRSGLFKSIVARMLNTASAAPPPLAAIAPAAGLMTSQLRPPPPEAQ